MAAFRADVTKDYSPGSQDGIPEAAVRPWRTLHLTVGVMSLLTQERVDSALKLLRSLDLRDLLSVQNPASPSREMDVGISAQGNASQDASKDKARERDDIKPAPLKATLRGLTSMHAASKTSILYSAPVDNDRRLYAFCLKLKESFTAADLLVPDTRPLLLHATIVNTIYVPGIRGKGSRYRKERAKLTIDARDILEKYQDFEWMTDVRMEKVAICRMGAQKMEDGNEEYIVEAEVEIP